MRNTFNFMVIACLALLAGCIGDDVIDDRVPEKVRITSVVDTLAVGEMFQFEATYFNEVGVMEERALTWESSNISVIDIDNNGLASALILGNAIVVVKVIADDGNEIEDHILIEVTQLGGQGGGSGSRSGVINTTSSYTLEGDFTLQQTPDGVLLTLEDNFKATTALPGLYVYLGNNNTSIGTALEIGKVTQFEGKHSYSVKGVGINDNEFVLFWCKPFNVKVGEGIFNN